MSYPPARYKSNVDTTKEDEKFLFQDDAGLRELLDRYRFALRYLKPTSRVLDCACGTGYGTSLIAQVAEDVQAIDNAKDSIQFCRARYASSGIRFDLGDAESLTGIESESIDAYLCFETLEYVSDPEKLLSEAKRVLAPRGVFLVSSLNRIFSGWTPEQTASEHQKEWSMKEFDTLLRRFFPKVDHFVQRVKSESIFHPRYMVSKGKRLTGFPDVSHLRIKEKTLDELEEGKLWSPMVLLAACHK